MNPHLASQLNSLLAAMILLTAFGLVVQRRMNALLHLFAWQGFLLAVSTAIVGYMGGAHDLYISSVLTLMIKLCCSRISCTSSSCSSRSTRKSRAWSMSHDDADGIGLVSSYHLTAPIRSSRRL